MINKYRHLVCWFLFFPLLVFLGGCKDNISPTPYIEISGDHPGNIMQTYRTRLLDVIDGDLVVFTFDNGYFTDPDIIRINSKGYESIRSIDSDYNGMCMYDGFLYYFSLNYDGYDNDRLYSLDLETGTEIFLGEFDCAISSPTFLARGASPSLVFGEERECYPVEGGVFAKEEPCSQSYEIGNRTYTVGNSGELLTNDPSGKIVEVASGYNAVYLPYSEGLLIFRQNSNKVLSYLNPDGSITDLVNVDAYHVISSFNYHENLIFVSYLRLQSGESGIGLRRIEGDLESGTYRIDMNDNTVTKISNESYVGIYIFNDKHLYCVDINSNIFQVDFDGNVVQTIVAEESGDIL